jgi:hypothetical protein
MASDRAERQEWTVMKIGNESVVMGKVSESMNVGDRSVVIGATDSRGNTIINTPMAVGYGAKAGPGCIAIGAYASAGSHGIEFPDEVKQAMSGLVESALQRQNVELISALKVLANELNQPQKQTSAIHKAWDGVQALATLDGVTNLVSSGAEALLTYLAKSGA